MRMTMTKQGQYVVVKVCGKTREEVVTPDTRKQVFDYVQGQGHVVDAMKIDNPVYPVDSEGNPIFTSGAAYKPDWQKKLAGFCAEYHIYIK